MDPRLVSILEKTPIGKQIELLFKLPTLSKKRRVKAIRQCLPSMKTLCFEVARFMCVTFEENHRVAMGGQDRDIVQFRKNHYSALINVDMQIVHGLVIMLAFYADDLDGAIKKCITLSVSDVMNLKDLIFRDRVLPSPSSSLCLSQVPRSPPDHWDVSPIRLTHSLPSTSPPKRKSPPSFLIISYNIGSKKNRTMVSLSKLRNKEKMAKITFEDDLLSLLRRDDWMDLSFGDEDLNLPELRNKEKMAKITFEEDDLLSLLRRDDLMDLSFGDEDLNLPEVTSEGQSTFTTRRGTVLNRLNIPSVENLTISQQARLDCFELSLDDPWGNRVRRGRLPQIEGTARFLAYMREEAARIAAYKELLSNPPEHVFAPVMPTTETPDQPLEQPVDLPQTFDVYHDTPGDELARPPAIDAARPPLTDLPTLSRPPKNRSVPRMTRGNVRYPEVTARDRDRNTIKTLNSLLIPRTARDEEHQTSFSFDAGSFINPDEVEDLVLVTDDGDLQHFPLFRPVRWIRGDPQTECPANDAPRPPFLSMIVRKRFPDWCNQQVAPPDPGTPPHLPPLAAGVQADPYGQTGPVLPDTEEPIAPIPRELEGSTTGASGLGLHVQPVLGGESAVSGANVGAVHTSLSTPRVNILLPSPATVSSVSATGLAVPSESGTGRPLSLGPHVSAPPTLNMTGAELDESSSTNVADLTALHRRTRGGALPAQIEDQPLEVPAEEAILAPIMSLLEQENILPPPPPEAEEPPARPRRRRRVREEDSLSDIFSGDYLSPPRRRRRRRRRRESNLLPTGIEQAPIEPVDQQLLPQPVADGDQVPAPENLPRDLPNELITLPQPMELVPLEVIPRPSTSATELNMPEDAPPPEPQPEYVPPSPTRLVAREILATLRAKAAEKNTNVLTFADICPPAVTTKTVAALTFQSLIVLAQQNLVKLHQTEPTGIAQYIFITLLE